MLEPQASRPGSALSSDVPSRLDFIPVVIITDQFFLEQNIANLGRILQSGKQIYAAH
jgi:hypothetical protein